MGRIGLAIVTAAAAAASGCGTSDADKNSSEPQTVETPSDLQETEPATDSNTFGSKPDRIASPEFVNYKAIGGEPAWALHVDGDEGRWRFGQPGVPDDTGTIDEFDVANGAPTLRGSTALGTRLVLRATTEPCSDRMSALRYAHSVSLNIGERSYRGCGGGALPPLSLTGTRWTVLALGDRTLEQSGHLHFQADRLFLTGWCPDVVFQITSTGPEGFTVGSRGESQIMCRAITLPGSLTNLLRGRVEATHSSDNVMTLRANGVTATFRRSI